MATSAYQIEGAAREDGRGPSIWDTFSHTPGRTWHGDTGDIACDGYHRFDQDAMLMAELGIRAYRFSVAWPRVQPDGLGPANRPGLDHYRRLVDALLRRNITPVVTLYHWDLPQALEDAGGWPNRDTALRFADYAALVHGALRDEVSLWITLNEPWVTAWHGYGTGIHAPGRTDDGLAIAASHHLLLGHAMAADALGGDGAGGGVGITLNFTPIRSASDDPEDVAAAELADQHANRLFVDPLAGRGYPPELLARYGHRHDLRFIRDGDLETISRLPGFLGVNYYTRHTVSGRPLPEWRAVAEPGHIDAWSFVPPDADTTAMGWAIDPAGLTDLLLRLHRDYPAVPIYVTENGAAFDDYVDPEGDVDDLERIAFLRDHLTAAHDAIVAGVDLAGYFAWSFMDNFEWAQGYSKRFGLVYVDYASQRRIPKRSARWYGDVVARGSLARRGDETST